MIPRSAFSALCAVVLFSPPTMAQDRRAAQAGPVKPLTYAQSQRGTVSRVQLPPARFSADGTRVLLGRGAAARSIDPATGESRPSTPAERAGRPAVEPVRRRRRARRTDQLKLATGEARLVTTAPDKKLATFVRGHDLWVYDKESKQETQLTTNGSEDLYHGELDWVYQEEIYGRGTFRAQWWSPDSKRVAFLSLVTKDVPSFPLVNILPIVPKRTELRYPKVGQPNPIVSLTIAEIATGAMTKVALDGLPSDRLIVRVGWTPDSRRCLFMVQDRIQTWLELCEVDPATGERRTMIREEATNGWTDRLPFPRWLADGRSFLWTSHASGYRKLVHYNAKGKPTVLWKDDFGMSAILRVDEKRGEIFVAGYGDNSIDLHAWRVMLDGSGATRLTEARGTHRVTPSPDGQYVLDAWSSLENPGQLELRDRDGSLVRVLAKGVVENRNNLWSGTWEVLSVPARDGYRIDAAVLGDPARAAGAKRPVWIETYSGPHAPSVRNTWNGRAWYHFLAQEGVLVVQLNVRSAEPLARMKSVHACYKNFGVQELRDIEDVLAYVCKEKGGDATRTGITGWSFGGTMTAYALTHSKAFSLGVAGAGVYDWRLYDTIYTERYMSTDRLNPSGYQKSSVIAAAKDLHGHLVLYHGTEDDNVHFQNCMQLVYALQRANKDFELMIFPNATHSGGGGGQRALRGRMTWRAIRKHLLGHNV